MRRTTAAGQVRVGLAVAPACFAAALLSFALAPEGGGAVPLWASGGVAAGSLLLAGGGAGWAAGVLGGSLGASALAGHSTRLAASLAAANLLGPALIGAVLRRRGRATIDLNSVRGVALFLVASGLGTAAGTALLALGAVPEGDAFWQNHLVAGATGVLVFAPPVALWRDVGAWFAGLVPARRALLAVLLCGLVGLSVVHAEMPAGVASFACLGAVVLVFAAYALGAQAIMGGLALQALVLAADVGGERTSAGVQALHLFQAQVSLLACAAVAFLAAGAVGEQRRLRSRAEEQERRAADAVGRLKARTTMLDAIFASAPYFMALLDAGGKVLAVNRAGGGGAQPPGQPGALVGQVLRCINALGAPGCGLTASCANCPVRVAIAQTLRTGEPLTEQRASFQLQRDEAPATVHFLLSTALVQSGGEAAVLLTLADVTARTVLEEQLRNAQKMEAVGQLTGGMAHDFNNILNVIKGYGFLLQMELPREGPAADYLRDIAAATERGAELTRSLLAFGRPQRARRTIVDAGELVRSMEGMMRRALGERVRLETRLAAAPAPVLGDAGRLGQVLLNFATNARDAMPDGGVFTASVSVQRVPVARSRPEITLPPGDYVTIVLSDTGIGMDEPTRRRIFEPFFTTKEPERGTGLGLSVVFGIVADHGGQVSCASEPGAGATFTVYLPLALRAEVPGRPAAPEGAALPGGDERLLVAEDDEAARRMLTVILRERGYQVVVAADGGEALAQIRGAAGPFALLLLDVMMPGASGLEVLAEARRREPGVPAILMSGYSDELMREAGLAPGALPVLRKPIEVETLCVEIRRALDRGAAAGC